MCAGSVATCCALLRTVPPEVQQQLFGYAGARVCEAILFFRKLFIFPEELLRTFQRTLDEQE